MSVYYEDHAVTLRLGHVLEELRELVADRTPMRVRPGPSREAALAAGSGNGRTDVRGTMLAAPTSLTTGWRPSCTCPGRDGVGSGTTCAVALSLGRKSIGIDLNPDYLALARTRILAPPTEDEAPEQTADAQLGLALWHTHQGRTFS